MADIFRREAIYLWYYFDIQLRQVFWYWVLGMVIGPLVVVFLKDRMHDTFRSLGDKKPGVLGIVAASAIVLRFLKNLGRNIKATAPMFLLGIALSALFQRYVPKEVTTTLFGGNEAWGVLMAATIGGPLYACGGGLTKLRSVG